MPSPVHGRKPPNPQKIKPKPRNRRVPPPPPRRGGNDCCPMVAAARSVKQGRFRLAARYTRLSARLIAARIV